MNFLPLQQFELFQPDAVDIIRQTSDRRSTFRQDKKTLGVISFRDLNINHLVFRIGASSRDVKKSHSSIVLTARSPTTRTI